MKIIFLDLTTIFCTIFAMFESNTQAFTNLALAVLCQIVVLRLKTAQRDDFLDEEEHG